MCPLWPNLLTFRSRGNVRKRRASLCDGNVCSCVNAVSIVGQVRAAGVNLGELPVPPKGSRVIQVRALRSHIGAEVSGIDIKSLSEDDFATLYQGWLERNVLVIHGQDLEIEDFLRYSRRFGVLAPHPSKSTRHLKYPEITMLGANKFDADGNLNMAIYRRGVEGWHTDDAMTRCRSRRPSYMPSRSRVAAATHCSQACTPLMTHCRRH
jgi:hypothetical protein